MRDLAEIALAVAKEAGHLIMAGYRVRPHIDFKGPKDLVTEWDLRSEEHIRERLSKLCPSVSIVGEETGGELSSALTFYCDPLDGTTNFAHGHPFFAVSIGAMANGIPEAGAVVAPALNICWSGSRDHGAIRNGEPCTVSATACLDQALLATGFPPIRDRKPHNNLDAYVRAKPHVQGIRRCGSASIDLCLVADGTYDGYWERALHAWDLVAGAAIVEAASGQITALDGSMARLEIGHLVASNGHLHQALLELVGESPMRLP